MFAIHQLWSVEKFTYITMNKQADGGVTVGFFMTIPIASFTSRFELRGHPSSIQHFLKPLVIISFMIKLINVDRVSGGSR